MNSAQGWWRFPGHFLIWAAVPNIVSYTCHALGVHNAWLALLGLPALLLFSLIVLIREVSDVLCETHTIGKAALDFASKVAGFALGVTTWQWWFF